VVTVDNKDANKEAARTIVSSNGDEPEKDAASIAALELDEEDLAEVKKHVRLLRKSEPNGVLTMDEPQPLGKNVVELRPERWSTLHSVNGLTVKVSTKGRVSFITDGAGPPTLGLVEVMELSLKLASFYDKE
jgi:molybdopterin biosynthesis enzyme